jgi:hypothetical protein
MDLLSKGCAATLCVWLSVLVLPVHAQTDQPTQLYRQKCLNCHGLDGKGTKTRAIIPQIPDFTHQEWQDGRSDVQIKLSITDGKGESMPAFRDKLTAEQVERLIGHIRRFAPKPPRRRAGAQDFQMHFDQLKAELRLLQVQFWESLGDVGEP